MAKKVDDLPVYRRAVEFSEAVIPILKGPGVRRDRKLREQITQAIDSIEANIEEGFEQGSDRAFAHFLTISKGSAGEMIGHLRRARRRGYITVEEMEPLVERAEELGKMLGGFIKYLDRCDWKDRGRHKVRDAGSGIRGPGSDDPGSDDPGSPDPPDA